MSDYRDQEAAAEIGALLDEMNAANNVLAQSRHGSPYSGYEITETGNKFHYLNSILTNGQRSALFLIDRKTLAVYGCRAYGKRGTYRGTVAQIIQNYREAREHNSQKAEVHS